MKKMTLLLAVPLLMIACGDGEKEKDSKEDKGPDIDAMAKEYCECMDKSSLDEMSECLETFKNKYKDVKGSDEQKKELEEKVEEHCGDL